MKAEHMQNKYDQLVANEKNTNIGAYVLGGIYTLNLIDILLAKPFDRPNWFSHSNIESDVKVGITQTGPSIQIGIQF